MAESVMIALTEKGMGRQEAHEVLRKGAIDARNKDIPLGEVLRADKRVKKLLPGKALDKALDYSSYIGVAVETVDRLARKIKASDEKVR